MIQERKRDQTIDSFKFALLGSWIQLGKMNMSNPCYKEGVIFKKGLKMYSMR